MLNYLSLFSGIGAPEKALVNLGVPFHLPVECERLQGVPDNYTSGVSDKQRYTMLGNGWTVDVIAHILKGIKV